MQKKVTVPFEENFDWAHQNKLENMKICENNVSEIDG